MLPHHLNSTEKAAVRPSQTSVCKYERPVVSEPLILLGCANHPSFLQTSTGALGNCCGLESSILQDAWFRTETT